jgi:hypothetical protein
MFVKIKFLECHYTLWCAGKIGKNVGVKLILSEPCFVGLKDLLDLDWHQDNRLILRIMVQDTTIVYKSLNVQSFPNVIK